ncbi:MAG TPA: tectonin domain-containing protein [Chitinophagaceae bacterium]|nr:tectonin domain-containing protein [Chitinophagaceae bacterium]
MRSATLFTTSFFVVIAFCAWNHHPSKGSMSSWVKLSGSDGKDICVTDKGEFYLVNTAGKFYTYEGPKWKQQLSQLKNIKFRAANKGVSVLYMEDYWLLTDYTKLRNPDATGKYYWDETDVAIGWDSTLWNLRSNNISYASKFGSLTKLPGPAISRIGAGRDQVWMIDKQGKIYRLKDRIHIGMGWELMPGGDARDITVSNENYVFMVDNKGRIYQWTGFRWDQLDGSDGLRIAANNRKLLLINTQREIYTRSY